MENNNPVVLVVDDEKFNLELIEDYLNDVDFNVLCVDNGAEALTILQNNPTRFSAVLLDRMMPGMNGMEVLSNIKSDESINQLPVIMQTAKIGRDNMLEGLQAGAHYYLSKPYDQQTLVAIVSSAVRDYQHYLRLQEDLNQSAKTLLMMDKGTFTFKSLEEGRSLASLLAKACPNPERVALGLTELITNSVEHGNLGITYKEKSKLNYDGTWESEVIKRLSSQTYKDRFATVEFVRDENEITLVITDQGDGFDWQQYMEVCPERAFDSHGRGIVLAKSVSFNKVEYLNNGNQVCVTVSL